jgi:hypothetical protein
MTYISVAGMVFCYFNILPVRTFVFLHEGQIPPTAKELRLANEVCEVLKQLQPQNPARVEWFNKAGTGGYLDLQTLRRYPIARRGWTLVIVDVEQLDDGWRAEACINIDIAGPGGKTQIAATCYYERYRYRDDVLTIEKHWIERGPRHYPRPR